MVTLTCIPVRRWFWAGTARRTFLQHLAAHGESFFPVGMWAQSSGWINLFGERRERLSSTTGCWPIPDRHDLPVVVAGRQTIMSPPTARLRHRPLATLVLQVGLGSGTLLMHVPVVLAAAHQEGRSSSSRLC